MSDTLSSAKSGIPFRKFAKNFKRALIISRKAWWVGNAKNATNATYSPVPTGLAGSLNAGGGGGSGGSSGGDEIKGGTGGQGGGFNPSQVPTAGGDSRGHDGDEGDGGAAGGNGAAIRRNSGYSITVVDPGNGITGSITATGVN